MTVTSWTLQLPRRSAKRAWASFPRSAPPSLSSMTAWSVSLRWSEKFSRLHIAHISAVFISAVWSLNSHCTLQARCFEEENSSLERQVAELRERLNGRRGSVSSTSTAAQSDSSLDAVVIRLRRERVGPAALLVLAAPR